MHKEVFFCSCGHNEHFFILTKFDDEKEYAYLSIYLSNGGFLKRLGQAIKHVFGYRSKYGHFSEICLDADTRLQLTNFLHDHNVFT